MPEQSLTLPSPMPEDVLYARFPRRIQAVVVDGAILVCLLLLGPTLAASLPDSAVRLVNRAVLACLVLYEPVLVSVFGGTVGHYLLNLRVVSATTGGRLPFYRALIRVITKAVVGIISFFFIAFTARHQALHDVVARAVVRVRDPSRANPADFAAERLPELLPATPASRLRRAAVAGGYIMFAFFLAAVAAGLVTSQECLNTDRCSAADDNAAIALLTAWLLVSVVLAVLGRRGRLPGARHREPDGADLDDPGLRDGDAAIDPQPS